jgi:hypothetical protein
MELLVRKQAVLLRSQQVGDQTCPQASTWEKADGEGGRNRYSELKGKGQAVALKPGHAALADPEVSCESCGKVNTSGTWREVGDHLCSHFCGLVPWELSKLHVL